MKPADFYKPDIRIFLVLIPFISAFNYFLTYSNIGWNSFTLLTYSIDTLQGYLAWWIVRMEIIWLDGKVELLKAPIRRTLIQVTLTTLSGLGVIILTTEIISLLVKGKPAIPEFYTLDVLIIMIWFFVINGIYIGLYFFNTLKYSEIQRKNRIGIQAITVKSGNKIALVHRQQIVGLSIEDDYVFVFTRDGKKHILEESLDYWEGHLPETDFFRINRKTILSRSVIQGFQKLEHGKLLIQLSSSEQDFELGISRAKAPSFRAWFMPND